MHKPGKLLRGTRPTNRGDDDDVTLIIQNLMFTHTIYRRLYNLKTVTKDTHTNGSTGQMTI